MPDAPALPCRVPGCKVLGHCVEHAAQLRSWTRPEWDGWYRLARWRNPVWGMRARVLRAMPLCVECRALGLVVPTTQVDHVIPHRGSPALFWNFRNLQGLCDKHHSEKTARGE